MKVLIAEDEPPIARALAGMVAEMLPEAEVVGLASDGQQAIDLADRLSPDLILTDIRMPVKTGIDLIRHCREKSDRPYLIVVSGYKDFEYAQEAIRYGAVDYVLKPVEPEELAACFARLRQRLAEEEEGASSGLVLPGPGGSELRLEEELSFPLELLCMADSRLCPQTAAQPNLPRFAADWQSLPPWLKVQAHFPDADAALHFLVIGRTAGSPSGEIPRRVLECCLAAQDNPVTLSPPVAARDATELRAAMLRLERELPLSTVFGSSQIAEDPPAGAASDEYAAMQLLKPQDEALAQAMRTLSPEGLRAVMSGLMEELRLKRATSQRLFLSLRLFGMRCLSLVGTDQAASGVSDQVLDLESIFASGMASSADYEGLQGGIAPAIEAICAFASSRRSYYRSLVESIDACLTANIDQNITVQKVADSLGLDADYLSRSFKKETGKPLSQHIIAFRMARAAEFIERHPDALVKHVAQAHGYSDPLYFSRLFKAQTGKWPSELLGSAGRKSDKGHGEISSSNLVGK